MMQFELPAMRTNLFRRRFLIGALASGLLLAVLFSLYPGLDTWFSGELRAACGGDERHSGWCHENGILVVPRYAAMAFTSLVCMAAMVAAARPLWITRSRTLALRARGLFMLAVIAAGPGVLTNVILKDHWGRARPREVAEFGGTKSFTPPLVPARQCVDNCSFVSGEAAAVFAPFFAAALVFPHVRLTLVGGGIIAGFASGLVRISTGGHFLSDVLFAGVFMALMALATHSAMFGFGSRRVRSVAKPQDMESGCIPISA